MKTASWTLWVLVSITAITQANSQVPADPCLGYLLQGNDPDRYERCLNDQLDDASEEVGLLCEVASYVGGGRVVVKSVRFAVGQSCPDNAIAYAEAAAWRAAQDALRRRTQCLQDPYRTWENGACVLAKCNAGQTLSNGVCVTNSPPPAYEELQDEQRRDCEATPGYKWEHNTCVPITPGPTLPPIPPGVPCLGALCDIIRDE